ncbi:MAG: phage holin family protein [Deltaproteobacteria bacterium]|nr:phage holin family protein [Deltaproteobacteria bacterium]
MPPKGPAIDSASPVTSASAQPAATPKPSTAATVTSSTSTSSTTSATSALDAASGTTSMEVALRANESGPPKVDGNKLTAGIGETSGGSTDKLVGDMEADSVEHVETAGESPAGDSLSKTGTGVAIVGAAIACIPVWPVAQIVGAIVAAVGGILALVGDGVSKGAETSGKTIGKNEEDRLKILKNTFSKEKRPNLISQNLTGETPTKPDQATEEVSSSATAMLEHNDMGTGNGSSTA